MGYDGQQRRYIPLDAASRMLRRRLPEFEGSDFEGHLTVWICAEIKGTKVIHMKISIVDKRVTILGLGVV